MLLINKPGRYSYYKLELTCFELVYLVMLNDQTLSIIWISWVCAGVFIYQENAFVYLQYFFTLQKEQSDW